MESEKEKRSEAQRFMVFSLGGERFAIPLLAVKEVIAVPSVTPIPEAPTYFLGIMNLRGQIIPIVDMRLKLKIKRSEGSQAENAVVILDLGPFTMGVVVDAVSSVLAIEKSSISPCPEGEAGSSTPYLQGVVRTGEGLVLLLDVTRVLNVDEKKILEQKTNQKAA